MRIYPLLQCIAKHVVKQAGNLAAFGLGDLAVEVWNEWHRDSDEAARRAELQAVVQMAADEFRQQVEAVVREVAAGLPAAARQQVSVCLEQIPDLLRSAFRRPEDPQGRSVPPGLRLRQAEDLVPLLSSRLGAAPVAEPPAARVTLHFTQGQRANQEIVCTEPAVLLFGRAEGCNPLFPRKGHERVSRHHCLVELNPPDVRLRDLGSMHGTFLNGNLIGNRPKGQAPDQTKYASPEHDLRDGDEVRLTDKSQVAFRVSVVVPAHCAACGALIAEGQKAACAVGVTTHPGPLAAEAGPRGEQRYLCPACRRRGAETAPVVRTCCRCGREVTAERGANRPGQFVCGDCRANQQGVMHDLMGQARAGNQELRAIRDYTLLEELGHGGMGAVYLARHQRTGQPVAIKLMLPKVAADDRAVGLFQREVRNTMALQHRHVVRLLDHGYACGTFFMVLDYCDGGSVDRLMIQRGGTLAADEAGEIMLQALEGLEYAHQADIPFVKRKDGGYGPGKGLAHRDLKPANLFLTGWGSGRIAQVGDYGLAKAFDETGLSGGTRTGDVGGTWKFMYRQQVVGYKDPGPEADVWAMAASLYNMLTGAVPRDFPEDTYPWVVVLTSDPVPILQRNPHVPPRLAEVIDHALKEEPAMPFQTAAAFKEALERAL
ncbi:MAG TPA: protein kinase [Gemmataceae bacterium]|nr:protein kinase [Gemmataceae bacterium]